MTTLLDLSISGARDAFGHFFRDWHVVGWEQDRVPPEYVCEPYCNWRPMLIQKTKQVVTQLDLFGTAE